MDVQHAIDLGQEALLTALLLSAPALAVGLAIALVCGFLQAATQIQDQSLSLVPKLVGVGLAVLFCLPWLVDRLLTYTHDLLANVPASIGGG